MKRTLDKDEIMDLLKKAFPPEMIPAGYYVERLEEKGYPVKEFIVTLEKGEETK